MWEYIGYLAPSIIFFLIIIKILLSMKEAILNLRNEVSELKTVNASAKALIAGFGAKLDAAIKAAEQGNLDELNALSSEISASTDDLAAAVAANTPSQGE